MILNCGKLGLDWERLSISGYLEALYATDSEEEAAGPSEEERARLKLFMDAHRKSG